MRGLGLLAALELGNDDGPALVRKAREHGLLINAARPHCLRFMPRLNNSAEEIDQALGLLDLSLAELRRRGAVTAG